MRFHQLTVSAFGPFPESVEVDFDEVCSAGLFLIHGATGSGKTSLLDAICFALFADVPGARTRRGLRSDHAPEGTRPVVELEFTAVGRRFRIERSPEFTRPKKRGTGETRVPPAVVLEEFRDGRWEPVSTRHDEVADHLRQVLGMGLAQFAKVVVLPQGDVAAFLRADPEERRSLLERLFDISVFTDVEAWLTEERRRTSSVVDELQSGLARQLTQLDDALGTTNARDWHSLDVTALGAALTEQADELRAEVFTLLGAADESVTALTAAAAEVQRVQALVETRAKGLRAQADRTAALDQADQIAELRQTVARAQAAEALAGHLSGLQAAAVDVAQRRDELSQAAQAAGLDAGDGSAVSGLDRTELAALAAQLHEHDEALSELTHVAAACARTTGERDRALEDHSFAEVAMASCTEARDQASSAVQAARAQVREISECAATLPAAERDHRSAGLAVQTAGEVAELRAARAAAAPSLVAVQDDVLTAQATLIELRQRRLDGMAAELAGSLSADEPCPVCGSQTHPAPAQAVDLVTADEIETAEETLTEAEETLAALTRVDTERQARIGALLDLLGPDSTASLDELIERRSRTGVTLREATTATEDLVVAEETLTGFEEGLVSAQAELDRAHASLTAARTRAESTTTRLEELRTRRDELLATHAGCPCVDPDGSSDGPDAVVGRHTTIAAATDRLVAATAAYEDALTRHGDRESAALAAAQERDFADLDEAREAVLEPDVLIAHQRTLDQHAKILAGTSAILADDADIAALAAPEPDLAAAREAAAEAGRTVKSAQAAHSEAEARCAVLSSVQTQVTDIVAALGPAAERATAIRELADAATGVGGGNVLKMRLSSFVLAARLEKVVALANERLQQMDAGRYLLEHSDARVSGGRRSGLDLRVLDQWTGRTRETSSLSGGESFMVSLALALGLADAVREEAGGFDLGTLFVDEGFGSLDEESLEHVMSVLDGLREGGRAVGVVSHVPDLRARITHQVVVEKTSAGSNVAIRTVA